MPRRWTPRPLCPDGCVWATAAGLPLQAWPILFVPLFVAGNYVLLNLFVLFGN